MDESVSVLSKVEGVARRREEQLIQKTAREKVLNSEVKVEIRIIGIFLSIIDVWKRRETLFLSASALPR